MKRVMVSAAIMASMFAIAPVAAQQPYGQTHQGQNHGWNGGDFWRGAPTGIWERIQFLQQRIDRGVQDGSLDRREAGRAQFQLSRIRQDASHLRRRSGGFRNADAANLQARLDNLSRNLRWQRHNGRGDGYQGGGYADSSSGYRDPYATDYDAVHYYRDGPQYQERRLSAQDEVYRGSDGRYYCKRNDGTTGLIVGGVAGAVAGNVVDGGRHRTAGTLIGGALGALAGKAIEQNGDVRCR
jgi:hypothetical protein